MLDISSDFRDLVRAHRERLNIKTPASEILKPVRTHSPFSKAASDVYNMLQATHAFLHEHRSDYVNASRHLVVESSSMTDEERDNIDQEVHLTLKQCCQRIDQLKASLESAAPRRKNKNQREHEHGMVMHLYEQLHRVTQVFEAQRGVRVQKLLAERERVHLPDAKKYAKFAASVMKGERGAGHMLQAARGGGGDGGGGDDAASQLTAEERQQLELENNALLDELQGTLDLVRSAEQKAMEISALSNLFSSKVVQQAEQIERLHGEAVESHDNVKEANEQLRQATESNVTFRMFLLVFLIVASFTLLFLDWYT